jgi:UDPglucose--hexose-1-phosphate uridylyltransferase
LDRYAIIASARMKRPTDFSMSSPAPTAEIGVSCPFCPSNEEKTPPADLLLVRNAEGDIAYERDIGKQRRRDWLVRSFPNLYPVAEPKIETSPRSDHLHYSQTSYGYHEVVIESPNHNEHPGVARVDQLQCALKTEFLLADRFSHDERIKYVQISRNHRKEAGASLSHAHSQVIALDSIPKLVWEELEGCRRNRAVHGDCVYCEIIRKEEDGPRTVFKDEDFLVIAPWASITPYELWIVPRNHEANILRITETMISNFAKTLRSTLGALSRVLGDPPYNYGVHTIPSGPEIEDYHWHVEILPRLAVWAGFELSTGIHVNVTPPELVAASLRDAVRQEWESLD